jgi:nucleoside-diphosphate-sugar epimerase
MSRTRFWASRRVPVTGAGGFIGGHVVERLVGEGANVGGFVRYDSRSEVDRLYKTTIYNV